MSQAARMNQWVAMSVPQDQGTRVASLSVGLITTKVTIYQACGWVRSASQP
jgi:hypothetical protein